MFNVSFVPEHVVFPGSDEEGIRLMPKEAVLSPDYQRKVIKAIHDTEAQEMAAREASARALRKGNAAVAKRQLQMAKILQKYRLQTDVTNGRAILCAMTEKIRELIPERLELPEISPALELDAILCHESGTEQISPEMMRELEANARAMEDREERLPDRLDLLRRLEKEILMEAEHLTEVD